MAEREMFRLETFLKQKTLLNDENEKGKQLFPVGMIFFLIF
jgi:hypothetical protein